MEHQGKVCTKCGEWKVYADYHKMSKMKDGYASKCKICKNEANRRYKENNEEKVKESRRKWVENNPNYNKIYFEENKEKITQYKKEWYEDNKDFEKQKDYRESNKEQIVKTKKCWYEVNKEHVANKNKQWYEINKEYSNNKTKQYYKENIEKENIRARKYYEENKEHFKKLNKIYYENNKNKFFERAYKSNLKRRSHKHKVNFKPHERKEILERDNYTCQCCGIKVHDRSTGEWNTPDKAEIDHIIPISKDGNSEPDNLQILCRTCNRSKSNNEKYIKKVN